jgi:hypothetical protein
MENDLGDLGSYKVPLLLQLPTAQKQCNGFGLIDLMNTSMARAAFEPLDPPFGTLLYSPNVTNLTQWLMPTPTRPVPRYNIDMEYRGPSQYLRDNYVRYGAQRFPVPLPQEICELVAEQAKNLVLWTLNLCNPAAPGRPRCSLTGDPCQITDPSSPAGDCPDPGLYEGRLDYYQKMDAVIADRIPLDPTKYVGMVSNEICLVPTSFAFGMPGDPNGMHLYSHEHFDPNSVIPDCSLSGIFATPTKGYGDSLTKYYLGDDFIFSGRVGGFAYAQVYWDETVFKLMREFGYLPDRTLRSSLQITPYLWRDASRVLRNLSAYVSPAAGGPNFAICQVDDVIAYGMSQPAMMLSVFLRERLNTGLAAGDPSFSRGLIFDGVLKVGSYGMCMSLSESPVSIYSGQRMTFPKQDFCFPAGGTLMNELGGQGKIIAIANSDEFHGNPLGGIPRAVDERGQSDGANGVYYRHYEIAAMPHQALRGSATPVDDYVDIGLTYPASMRAAFPAPESPGPVHRAMLSHLVDWLRDATPPPASVELELDAHGKTVLGADGNPVGGIRLPHVRTVEAGVEFGVPLGLVTDWNDTYYPCPIAAGLGLTSCKPSFAPPFVFSGTQAGAYYPYSGNFDAPPMVATEVPPFEQQVFADKSLASRCAEYYPSYGKYQSALEQTVNHAVEKGWVLKEDKGALEANAEEIMKRTPGCVPPSD